jgi:catechol 2,3-dioxygenase-like lactoylglutathione lyase family enzyme
VKAAANHFEVRVAKPAETFAFYRELLGYLGWEVLYEAPEMLGMGDGNVSLWFGPTPEDHRRNAFDRDATGLNHIGLHVDGKDDVDAFVRDYLQPHGIWPQFDTPRARPEFGPTYYQVMFVDPEGLALEVFHT